MELDQVLELIRSGGLTAFLLLLWWMERRERIAAEDRERIRMAARAVDGGRPDEEELPSAH